MADHDFRCSISGLPISDDTNVRVLLLVANEHPNGGSTEGRWRVRGLQLWGYYWREANAPGGFEEDIAYHLAQEQFGVDGCQGSDLEEMLKDGLQGVTVGGPPNGRRKEPLRPLKVTWAVIREDVWEGLVKDRTPDESWHDEVPEVAVVRASLVAVFEAAVALYAREDDESRELHLDPIEGFNDYVGKDPAYRTGVAWQFGELARMVAHNERDRLSEDVEEALTSLAELQVVRFRLNQLGFAWAPPVCGPQFGHPALVASTYRRWAELAEHDLVSEDPDT